MRNALVTFFLIRTMLIGCCEYWSPENSPCSANRSKLCEDKTDEDASLELTAQSNITTPNASLQLVYLLCCDDVRLEVGNKLSFMGVFQNIMVQQLPVSLLKFAVVHHWRGNGSHLSEVRILSPNREYPVVVSQPTRFEVIEGGGADGVSFFVNVVFKEAGTYWIQTLVDSTLFHEQALIVTDVQAGQNIVGEPETIN